MDDTASRGPSAVQAVLAERDWRISGSDTVRSDASESYIRGPSYLMRCACTESGRYCAPQSNAGCAAIDWDNWQMSYLRLILLARVYEVAVRCRPRFRVTLL